PEWARASRPLVLVFIAIAFVVTIIFDADVDAQGGAYATGVLVLMTSAAVAVTISMKRTARYFPFLLITLVFGYTTITNILERPEGIRIASFFIGLTVGTSLLSRALRSTELRVHNVHMDEEAVRIIESDHDKIIRVVAHRPGPDGLAEYEKKDAATRDSHHLSPT